MIFSRLGSPMSGQLSPMLSFVRFSSLFFPLYAPAPTVRLNFERAFLLVHFTPTRPSFPSPGDGSAGPIFFFLSDEANTLPPTTISSSVSMHGRPSLLLLDTYLQPGRTILPEKQFAPSFLFLARRIPVCIVPPPLGTVAVRVLGSDHYSYTPHPSISRLRTQNHALV